MSNIQLAKQVFYKVDEDNWETGFPVEEKEVNGRQAYGIVKKVSGDIFWCYAENVREIDELGKTFE